MDFHLHYLKMVVNFSSSIQGIVLLSFTLQIVTEPDTARESFVSALMLACLYICSLKDLPYVQKLCVQTVDVLNWSAVW
jgi:hypothetical protein